MPTKNFGTRSWRANSNAARCGRSCPQENTPGFTSLPIGPTKLEYFFIILQLQLVFIPVRTIFEFFKIIKELFHWLPEAWRIGEVPKDVFKAEVVLEKSCLQYAGLFLALIKSMKNIFGKFSKFDVLGRSLNSTVIQILLFILPETQIAVNSLE